MQSYKSIESLRAYMSWWVVIGHALGLVAFSESGNRLVDVFLILMGSLKIPVNVFIIVSGFVITHLFLGKKENYSGYITRRFFRIFPIYLFSLLVAILLTDLYQLAFIDAAFFAGNEARVERLAAQSDNFWTHFLLHITLLHGLIPDTILPYSCSTFLAPAWSLSLEWQFYLIAPFLIAAMARGILSMIVVSLILFVIALSLKSGAMGTWKYPAFLLLSIPYFLIGIISRLMMEKFMGHPQLWELPIVVVTVFTLCEIPEAIIWTVFFTIALTESGRIKHTPKIVQKVLNVFILGNSICTLGKWSYSTYLIHIPVFSLMIGSYVMMFGLEAITRQSLFFVLLMSMPVVLGLSGLLYINIELKGISLGKRFSSIFIQPTNTILETRPTQSTPSA